MLYIFDNQGKFKGELEECAGIVYHNSTTLAPDFSKVNDEKYNVIFNTDTKQWEYENLNEEEQLSQSQTSAPEVDEETLALLQEAKEVENLYNLAKSLNPFLKQLNRKKTKDAVKSI